MSSGHLPAEPAGRGPADPRSGYAESLALRQVSKRPDPGAFFMSGDIPWIRHGVRLRRPASEHRAPGARRSRSERSAAGTGGGMINRVRDF